MEFQQLVQQVTPRFFVRFLTRLADLYGIKIHPPSFPSQKNSLHVLRMLGWQPVSCIDVGAYHGEWALMFRSVFPEAKVLMVEAQSGKEALLRDLAESSSGHLEYAMAVLGDEDGKEVTFYEMETGSSICEEQSHFPRNAVTNKLVTLGTLLASRPDFQNASMIKLDTQGSELSILHGCPNLLQTVGVILLEVSLVATNKGAASFAEVVAFLNSAGFDLFDICNLLRRKDRVLWQADLLFIRRDSTIKIPTMLSPLNWG
jgi:FkbM family methyltransferase